MIDVDGNIVDQKEIVVVTKLVSNTTSFTNVSVYFQIVMKGGYALTITRSARTQSDEDQKQELPGLTKEITKIRDWVKLNISQVT